MEPTRFGDVAASQGSCRWRAADWRRQAATTRCERRCSASSNPVLFRGDDCSSFPHRRHPAVSRVIAPTRHLVDATGHGATAHGERGSRADLRARPTLGGAVRGWTGAHCRGHAHKCARTRRRQTSFQQLGPGSGCPIAGAAGICRSLWGRGADVHPGCDRAARLPGRAISTLLGRAPASARAAGVGQSPGLNGAHRPPARARRGAAGPPRAPEPGCGAEPHLTR